MKSKISLGRYQNDRKGKNWVSGGWHFELSGHNTAGICGFFYHDIFPYVIMLQFGGAFPAEWGDPDVVELECMDRANAVKIELKRIKDEQEGEI
ncbi:MAG: TIGR04076 family protein [Deltaproteobacteria bacterium]|nr:TIGR04076 family protein [Deltaproteobacteria bacterium]